MVEKMNKLMVILSIVLVMMFCVINSQETTAKKVGAQQCRPKVGMPFVTCTQLIKKW
jgi:hypothetical protein